MTTLERCSLAFIGGLLAVGVGQSVAYTAIPHLLDGWQRAGHDQERLHLVLVMFTIASWLGALAFLGPMYASAASLQWHRLPPDRRAFLGRYATAGVLAVLGLTGLVVVVPGWVQEARWIPVSVVCCAGLLGSLVLAAVGQRVDAVDGVRFSSGALAVTAVGTMAAGRGDAWGAALAGIVLAGMVASLFGPQGSTWRRPSWNASVPRWELEAAAQRRWFARAGLLSLDGSGLRSVAERRRAAPSFVPGGVRFSLPPWLMRVATTALRQVPRTVVIAWFTVSVAGAMNTVGATDAALSVLAMGAGAAGACSASAADRFEQAPALMRTYPELSRSSLVATPMVAMELVVATGLIALRPGLAAAAILLALPPLVAVRRLAAQRPGASLLMSSPIGAIPIDVVNRLVAGWDVVLVSIICLALV